MSSYVLAPQAQPSVPVEGEAARFPVHRIYCIGRNYADHAKEMGHAPEKGEPIFFMKPADAVVADGRAGRYPSATKNLHHEVELVVALGAGGRDLVERDALELVYGYAVGIDLTRRDLQTAAKNRGAPWDTGKGFDDSAPISQIVRAQGRHPHAERLTLSVNGVPKQSTQVADMLWPVVEIIVELSRLYELKPGDLIFTGTPAGVGPLLPKDRVECELVGWAKLSFGFA